MPDDKSPPPVPSDPTQLDRRAKRKRPASPPAAAQDERFEVREEIGKGGIGRVVEAWDGLLERDVAIKIVREDRVSSSGERFEREARITARLDHPNIVPVYDYWRRVADGQVEHRLAMKRIRGRDLGAVIWDVRKGVKGAREAWPRQWLLRVFQDICLGVAYAHSRGVLHRDLKPSNVMIGDFGETLVVDWGLAKVAGEANTKRRAKKETAPLPGLTMDGAIIGTPGYMSPEQAAGRSADIDERSDVYSLGAILYEILTLRRPLESANSDEILALSRDGRIPPPSQLLAAIPPDAFTPPAVPPELEAICTRAMSLRREERHPSARALHDDVQRFLDGVLDRDRRAREAASRAAQGRRLLARFRELGGEIEAAEGRARGLKEGIAGHAPAAAWKPSWDAEAVVRKLRDERVDAFTKAGAEFAQALSVDPSCADAADGQCELQVDRFVDAERRRDREDMRLQGNILAQHDRSGAFRAKLAAPARLTIRTHTFECDCLRPAKGWTVAFDREATVPWRDGRARPGVTPDGLDRSVPALTMTGGRFGHGPGCKRREVKGIEVAIARYEERDRRLVPVEERVIGRTPIEGVKLPQGSWRCELRLEGTPYAGPVLVPVRADRGGRWEQDVTLYRPGEIPDGFRQVSAGPFIFGGEWAGGDEAFTRVTGDLFVARTALTAGDYLAFLNDLASAGRMEEARLRQPRYLDHLLWFETEGAPGFRLPLPGEHRQFLWLPTWPVGCVSWKDALAYCEWRSMREGRLYTLLHEEEWEKCCRGVDGRIFSWGDEAEHCFSHHSTALEGRVSPGPVGSFPADESPFGLLDMSGEMQTWCLNASRPPFHAWRILRGGAWGNTLRSTRAAYRSTDRPDAVHANVGLRVVMRPEAWE